MDLVGVEGGFALALAFSRRFALSLNAFVFFVHICLSASYLVLPGLFAAVCTLLCAHSFGQTKSSPLRFHNDSTHGWTRRV